MSFDGFWGELERPIIGLAPMDGVTDAAFRYMVAKHGKPSVVYTEFTNVEGLARGAVKLLPAFFYDEIERPIVAQIFGVEVDSFYKSAVMLCEMGFDGIDINMGCPVKTVAARGGGAGLIKTPDLAKQIIRSVKRGVEDWVNGMTMEQAGVHEDIIANIASCANGIEMKHAGACKNIVGKLQERKKDVPGDGSSHKQQGGKTKKYDRSFSENVRSHKQRRAVPVSVKTRTGYDEVIAKEWVNVLLEERPAAICMHGRTLKQMYGGEADWEVLKGPAASCRENNVAFLGNGDVRSIKEACEKAEKYELDGVLIGRASLGNPWFFIGKEPSVEERILAVKEHCDNFERIFGDKLPFHTIKKHLAWYLKGFEGVKEVRMRLMMSQSFEEVHKILEEIS